MSVDRKTVAAILLPKLLDRYKNLQETIDAAYVAADEFLSYEDLEKIPDQLAKNFNIVEFTKVPISPFDRAHLKTIADALQALRDSLKQPVRVLGYQKNSDHIAVRFSVDSVKPAAVKTAAVALKLSVEIVAGATDCTAKLEI